MFQKRVLNQAKLLGVAPNAYFRPALHQQRVLSSRLPAPTRARILTRWYSSTQTASQADKDATPPVEEDQASDASKQEDPAKAAMEAKDREIIDMKDKYLRSVADYRNLQERSRREQQAAKDFAIQRFSKDLIESVDNLDLALSNVPADKLTPPKAGDVADDTSKDLRELHNGLKMTERVLMNTLKKHGLERTDPVGDKFDPNFHEATFQTPQPDKTDGHVFHVTQKGFLLNGRVLRAAKVGVVKNS